jgi:hypothetical protein
MDNDGDYLTHFVEMPNTPPLLPSRRGLIPAAASLPLIPRPNHPVASLRLRVLRETFLSFYGLSQARLRGCPSIVNVK